MSMDSDFTRKFPQRKSGIKASEVPVCWVNIGGYTEEAFHRQNVAESDPLLHLGTVNTICEAG